MVDKQLFEANDVFSQCTWLIIQISFCDFAFGTLHVTLVMIAASVGWQLAIKAPPVRMGCSVDLHMEIFRPAAQVCCARLGAISVAATWFKAGHRVSTPRISEGQQF